MNISLVTGIVIAGVLMAYAVAVIAGAAYVSDKFERNLTSRCYRDAPRVSWYLFLSLLALGVFLGGWIVKVIPALATMVLPYV